MDCTYWLLKIVLMLIMFIVGNNQYGVRKNINITSIKIDIRFNFK